MISDERIKEIAEDACGLKMDGKREYQSIKFSIQQAIRQALSEAQLTEPTVDKGEG